MKFPTGSRIITNGVVIDFRPGSEPRFTLIPRGTSGRVVGSRRRGTRSILFDDGTRVDMVLIGQLSPPTILDRIADAIADIT